VLGALCAVDASLLSPAVQGVFLQAMFKVFAVAMHESYPYVL